MSNKDTSTETTSGKWQWFLWGAASTLVVTMIFDEVVGLSKIPRGFANLEPEPTLLTTRNHQSLVASSQSERGGKATTRL